MKRFASALVFAAGIACGPSTPEANHPRSTAGADFEVQRAMLCARVRSLHDERCHPFDVWDASLLDDCSGVEGVYISATQDCVQKATCDAVQACIVGVMRDGAPYQGPTAPCTLRPGDSVSIPAGVSADDLERSYGRQDQRFSDSPSTAAHPIEVCGMPAEIDYLMRTTCEDGSRAFPTRAAADASRVGNVGRGGRCGRVIDEYVVPCPEHRYEVYIDVYRCAGG
jgi:hypothetical protein